MNGMGKAGNVVVEMKTDEYLNSVPAMIVR
jgi:hypothetical protein